MTNEVKIVPKLRFPGFESNWKEEKIKTLFKVVSGTTPLRSKKEYFDKAEVPWVKTTDLNNNVLRITDEKISNIAVKEGNMRILPENTLLIAMYGGFNQIGRTGIISFKSTINQAISALLDIEGKGDVNYLQAYFNYNVQKWKRLAASSRKDPNITKKDVENFKITIPTLKEQKRMGEFFSKLERQIELEEQKLVKLEEEKKGYMQKIFSQELRFKGNNGEEYPKWESKKLEEVAIINTGKSKIVNEESAAYSNLGSTGVLGKSSHYEYDGNFILTARVGHYAGKLYNFSGKANISDNTIFLETDLNLNFTLNMLNNYNLKRIAFGSGQPLIKSSELKKLIFNIPCGEEEQKIGGFLSGFDSLIGKQSHKIELLKERKKGFLQKMFV